MKPNRFNFRVWDKKNKCFLESFFIDPNGQVGVIYVTPPYADKDYNICVKNVIDYCNPKNIEVMQSTGIVDKNGKEIFEGDIIEFSTFRVVVKWEDCRFKIKSSCCDLALDIIRAEKCEVLGNIYENKELLGE